MILVVFDFYLRMEIVGKLYFYLRLSHMGLSICAKLDNILSIITKVKDVWTHTGYISGG